MTHPQQPPSNDAPRRGLARLSSLLLLLACLAVAVHSTAAAGQSPKPAAKQTRARRVVKPSGATPAARPAATTKPAANVSDAADASDANVTEATEATVGPEAVAAPAATTKAVLEPGVDAELARMRAEIGGATIETRGRLRRALADRLVALGRNDDALAELRLMIHEDRFDPPYFFNAGNALARLGDANAAADAYRKAVSQRRGNYARALNNLGVVLTRQGRWDEAHQALSAALTQENLNYAEASYNLGRLHLLRGERNLAQREWARTLRLQPDHADAAAALARAYAEEGDEKRAYAILENFSARAARTGGGVPREIAYARDAIIAASRAADAKPATSAANDSAASASDDASRRASLAPRFELDPAAYSSLESARAAGERGRHEEAIKHYRAVLSRSGGYFPPANLELSFALISLDRADEAVAALRPVAERDSSRFPVADYHLARLYERLGRRVEAARHFERAAELYGDTNPQPLVDLSRVREAAGDTRGALAAIEAYSVAIARQGSIPYWVIERADALRAKAQGAPPAKR